MPLNKETKPNRVDHNAIHWSHLRSVEGQIAKKFYSDATRTHRNPQEKILLLYFSFKTKHLQYIFLQ